MSSTVDAEAARWSMRGSSDGSPGLAPWVMIAFAIHATIAWTQHRDVPRGSPMVPTLEMELAPPSPRAIDDAPPPVAGAVEPPPRRASPTARIAKPIAEPTRGPARAGAALTAGESDHADDPVSFVTDPNGASYGGGVVAKGGVAIHGTAPEAPRGVAAPSPASAPADALVPTADLSRRPALEEGDPCHGFFPTRADSDTGLVTLAVVIESSGRVATASVIAEAPSQSGFGEAARACIVGKRFAPGLDREGRAVRTSTQVRIHFSR